jgi:hypothetical protein
VDGDCAKAVAVEGGETARMLVKTDAERAKTAAIARWGGEGLPWEVGAGSEKVSGIAVALSGLAGTMAVRWRPIQSYICKAQEKER